MSLFTYLLIILIIFIFLYYFFYSNKHKMTSKVNDAQQAVTISPTTVNYDKTENSNTNNFCYSVWFYVKDWNYNYGDTKVLFSRGKSPKVVIDKYQNNITTEMEVFSGSSSDDTMSYKCTINNIPVQKWVNLTISVTNRTLDTYLDGKLVKTCMLPGVPKVNMSSPLILTPDGGFSGYTSKLQYWTTSCSPQKAWDIYKDGYGGGFMNFFEKLKLKISFMENDVEVNSVTV